MLKRTRPLILFLGILIFLTACNFPGASQEPTTGPDVIYTAAAQTLIAQQTQAQLEPRHGCQPNHGCSSCYPTQPMVIVPTATPPAPTNPPPPTNTSSAPPRHLCPSL
jgi:hypothetical protein